MLEYHLSAQSIAHSEANFEINGNPYGFGITSTSDSASPMDLLIGAFSACVLKNVERFSGILKFEYDSASVDIIGLRSDKPPALHSIQYTLKIKSADPKLNGALLMKNLEKFGTIYNTLAKTCEISGELEVV